MITGLNHVTISVKDLERSFNFYRNTLGLKPLLKWPDGAYFLLGEDWFCLNRDDEIRNGPLPEYTHFAFSVSMADFESVSRRITDSGARVFKENKSEGASLYFLDPDGHKLEIHASDWKARVEHFKSHPKDNMEFFV